MRNLTITLLLIFTQSFMAQNIDVNCDNVNLVIAVPYPSADNIKVVDNISFNCAKVLLIQDNIVLYIYSMNGVGSILRGGKGGAKTINGIDRFEGDFNPMVVLIGCQEDYGNLTIGENIDIVFVTDNCNSE